jgi:hypothetical protein
LSMLTFMYMITYNLLSSGDRQPSPVVGTPSRIFRANLRTVG